MAKRVVYAWQEEDKFFLSPVPYDPNKRQPANWYDTSAELAAEASERSVRVKWCQTGKEAPDAQ